MEVHSSAVENGESNENPNLGYVGDVAEEDEENIKKRISSHPLFGLLIETHLKCLKVGLGELGEVGTTNAANQANFNPKDTIPRSSELDRFMSMNTSSIGQETAYTAAARFLKQIKQIGIVMLSEAYCIALGNLKEAIGEPQQGMASFIDAMYIQLESSSNSTQINNNPKSRF